MFLTMLKSKIHRATVTEANLNYMGSITIDQDLLEAAKILPHEKVQVVNINNGERFETYVIHGERSSGVICLNGAAARLAQPGDIIIIISYVLMTPDEASIFQPTIVMVDGHNHLTEISFCLDNSEQ
jgi:aspartate 1-decarboxylase